MLKLGLSWQDINRMDLAEAEELLEAHQELITPPTKTKKYKVRKTP